MRSKIARRLLKYFGTALFLFALIIGSVFVVLFRESAVQMNRDALRQRAEAMASALSGYASRQTGAAGGRAGYGAYLKLLDEIAMTDVWVVDREMNLITAGKPDLAYAYQDLPSDAEAVVASVFSGVTTFSESFSGFFDAPTMTVGTPIVSNNTAVGALLLHAPASGVDQAVRQGLTAMGISLAAALFLSAILAALLSMKFTRPLERMEAAAVSLAAGAYGSKTGITQQDEIGKLASAIDQLSEKLLDAEGEREKLNQLRQAFIASISHELRTPVTVLRGSLEALCDHVVDKPEQVEEYHRQMLSETIALERLVNDLMDLTRLENVDFPIEMQTVDLGNALDDAVRSARRIARAKNIEILVERSAPVIITGDYGRLRQMLLIVLDNAVKFSPAGSAVEVRLTPELVSIRDNGPGIPPEDLPHIFDRFYRASTGRDTQGSGLGLAIAKRIAERHGVKIEVASEPGRGTEFRFIHPMI